MFGIIIFMVACAMLVCCVMSAAAYKNSDIEMEEEVTYNPMTGSFEWEPLVK